MVAVFKLAPPPRLGRASKLVISDAVPKERTCRTCARSVWAMALIWIGNGALTTLVGLPEGCEPFLFYAVAMSFMHCFCILMSLHCVVVETSPSRGSQTSLTSLTALYPARFCSRLDRRVHPPSTFFWSYLIDTKIELRYAAAPTRKRNRSTFVL